jgi:DNA polymerase-3 subunit delta'
VGKSTFALLLAKTLLCETQPAAAMQPCNRCDACAQVEAATHPDLLQVAKPENRSTIPVELLIGRREARMQEGLCHDIRLRPFRNRRRIAIIQDADSISQEAGNCLLKTLEEPPAHAILILIGTSEQRQLPTIRSRCQTIRFAAPRGEAGAALLRARGVTVDDSEQANRAVELAGGDMDHAAALLEPDAGAFRQSFAELLERRLLDANALAKMVSAYVDEAGKEASKRRHRMREVFGASVQFYRQRLRTLAAEQQLRPSDLYRLDRSLDALNEVDRNANQATLVEAWAVDMQRGRNS